MNFMYNFIISGHHIVKYVPLPQHISHKDFFHSADLQILIIPSIH